MILNLTLAARPFRDVVIAVSLSFAVSCYMYTNIVKSSIFVVFLQVPPEALNIKFYQ